MTDRPRQLALDLPVEPRLGIEDFLVGVSNDEAYALIERWPDWPDQVLRLEGPEGSGKTHLASIWAARAAALTLRATDLTAERLPALSGRRAIVLEDADRGPCDEPAFFHLLNMMRASGGSLLVTARSAPEHWGLATPDLLSRLRLAPQARIGAPDDALLRAVIVKLFIDRQLVVDTAIVDYLILRIERSFAAAAAAVTALDRQSLGAGRRITRQLAATILAREDDEGADDGASNRAAPRAAIGDDSTR